MKDATFVEFGKTVGKQGRPRKEDGISYERMNQKILTPVDDDGGVQDATEDVTDRPVTAPVETKPPAETKVRTEPSVPAKPVAAIQDTTDDDDDDSNVSNVGINTDAAVDENGQVDIDALLSGM